MSDASRVTVRAVGESTFGTTPASSLQTIRTTGFSLKRNTQGTTSQEARGDRQIADWIRTGVSVEGDIPFELIYGNLDTSAADFLGGALTAAWATDTGLAGAQVGTDLLTNGTASKSFTIEAEYADIVQFHSFTGCRVNSLSFSITPGSIITGSLGFMGKVDAIGATTVGTGAATAAVTGEPMNAIDNISGITEGGTSVEVLQLDLSIANGLRIQPVVGTLGPKGIGYGQINVTGSARVYFADAALLTKYNNNTESSLGFTLTDAAGSAYEFMLDAIKFTDFAKPNSGPEGDVIATIPFQAFMDTTTLKTIRIARTA